MWSLLSKDESGAGVPIVIWPLAIVALIAMAGIGWAVFQGKRTKEVTVLDADLPPAHEIVEEDVKTLELRRDAIDDSDLVESKSLLGHVTTTTVAGEEPVPEGSVTASKPAGYANLVPLAFHVDSATAGKVDSGDWVRLHFAPTAHADGVEPVTARALLLSAAESEEGETDYVVAVKKCDREALLGVVARSRLLVTPAS
jgi:hypothetical protein